MKLIDLNPKWIANAERHGQGIFFDCPVHRTEADQRADCGIAVYFNNPLDGGPKVMDRNLWDRTGDTFETLTLAPSILQYAMDGVNAHWHGWIRNGEIINA